MESQSIAASEDQKFVAEVLNEDGSHHDWTFNWETAQCMAMEGYKIIAIADDGFMSREDIQSMCDAALDAYKDCFG